jgi:hypothetical protein
MLPTLLTSLEVCSPLSRASCQLTLVVLWVVLCGVWPLDSSPPNGSTLEFSFPDTK